MYEAFQPFDFFEDFASDFNHKVRWEPLRIWDEQLEGVIRIRMAAYFS